LLHEPDLSLLATALKPLAQQSQFLMLEELDEGLLWQLAQEYELVDLAPEAPQGQPVARQAASGRAGERQAGPSQPQAPPAVQPPAQAPPQPVATPNPAQQAPPVIPAAAATTRALEPSVGQQQVTLDPMAAKNLDSLHVRVRECEACDLSAGRRRVVFGQGNQRPRVMVIGDQPIAEEDMRGLAFVGAEQAMLDKVLFCLGLTRPGVYVTRMVKCRPDGDRAANPTETQACQSILHKQIELLQPKLILTLGEPALRGLVPQAPPWAQAKAQAFEVSGTTVVGIESLVEVLENLDQVPQLWESLRRVRQHLGAALAR